MKKNIVIVGDGEFAEIAHEYFTYDSDYNVVGFAVESEYITKEQLFGKPVVKLEEIELTFPPSEYDAFVAVTYTKLNRVRTRLFEIMKRKGYGLVSYISSQSFVWRDVEIGENCFIFEDNTLQYKVVLGNNIVLWSGNHIGHRTRIMDNCYLTSHIVVSGYCTIGESCFIGVNATIGDNVKIAKDCIVAAGSVVVKNLENVGKIYLGSPARIQTKSAYEQFGIADEE